MLFARSLQHIKNQNWSAVIFEFVLVVLGIFLALQVDNWNENRKDKIDEQRFMARLHADIGLAEELTDRVRDRRLNLQEALNDATDILFGRSERQKLTDAECRAVGVSSYFSVSVSDLPSLAELMSTGRMAIIRDPELRTALVGLQQIRDALALLISVQTSATVYLSSSYPQLIRVTPYIETGSGEVRLRYQCDSKKMRENTAFLNDLATNADQYDVFVRDGLAPWFRQLDSVHNLVDTWLGLDHE